MLVSAKIFFFSFIFVLTIPVLIPAQTAKFTFQRAKMGSPFIITVLANDSFAIQPVIDAAYRRVDTLNQIFSDYLTHSEINTVCRKAHVWQPISNDLYRVLKISEEAYHASNGAFDISVGPIVKVWRATRKTKTMPNNTVLQVALQKTGFKNIEIDKNKPQIRFRLNASTQYYSHRTRWRTSRLVSNGVQCITDSQSTTLDKKIP